MKKCWSELPLLVDIDSVICDVVREYVVKKDVTLLFSMLIMNL